VELLVTTFEEINLRVKQLGVVVHVQVPVNLSEGSVHLGASVLAELAVEDYDCLVFHKLLHLGLRFEKVLFDLEGRVKV